MTWYEFSDVRDGQSRRKYDCITVHRPLALKKSQHGKGRLAAGHLHEVFTLDFSGPVLDRFVKLSCNRWTARFLFQGCCQVEIRKLACK